MTSSSCSASSFLFSCSLSSPLKVIRMSREGGIHWLCVNSGLNWVISLRVDLTLPFWNCFSFHIVNFRVIPPFSSFFPLLSAAGQLESTHNLWSANHKITLLQSLNCRFIISSLLLTCSSVKSYSMGPPKTFIPLLHKMHLVCFFADRTASHLFISAVCESADLFDELSVSARNQLKKCRLVCICC